MTKDDVQLDGGIYELEFLTLLTQIASQLRMHYADT